MLRERAATSGGDVAYFTAYAVGLPTADALSRRRRPRRPRGRPARMRLALCDPRKQTPRHVGSFHGGASGFPDWTVAPTRKPSRTRIPLRGIPNSPLGNCEFTEQPL